MSPAPLIYPLPTDNPTPALLAEQMVANYQTASPHAYNLAAMTDFATQVMPLFLESMENDRIEALKRAAQVYRPQVAIRMVDTQLLEMQRSAAEAILQGAEWLNATQVGELAGRSASNPGALASRWKREGKLFCINWNGRDWYPRYAFDAVLQPRPLIAEVIKLFGNNNNTANNAASNSVDPWRIAAWFESSNAWLDDQKPHQCIDDAERILAAAQKKAGWQHG